MPSKSEHETDPRLNFDWEAQKFSETRMRAAEPELADGLFENSTLRKRTGPLVPPLPRERRVTLSRPSLRDVPPIAPLPPPRASWVNLDLARALDNVPAPQPFGSEVVGATMLSAVAGYVDAAGFLLLFGMFTAHITGELVAGSALMGDHFTKGLALRVLPLPIFMVSVGVATMLMRAARRRGGAPLVSLLGLMAIALAIFGTAGILMKPFMNGPDNWAVVVVGSAGVAAMAIQNLIMRDVLSGWSPTTIMTGNLTRVSIHIVDYAFPPSEADTRRRASVRNEATGNLVKFGLPLLGFIGGGALSAWVTGILGFYSIALPTVFVGAMALWQWRQFRC